MSHVFKETKKYIHLYTVYGCSLVKKKKEKVMRLEKIYLCQVQQVSLKVFVKHLNEKSL